ncbi:DNA polymerase III subunit alpha [Streptosporangium roseum]|uniref:DNA polymerase III subunit alpha n=1 Tax=Streptosporangium roseum (strain ATCC 12428 / DSM 43021 / JCM 3005 / KCTC 9067 / NCIMB 10171 / NRRL 2505 / NI 9100) TaxID=479432 RepID=D2AZX7_STRRD|nr:DNA polymerase III subunit alpha [Streptosporangium roseum]ACZ87211.1 DNA polymerase III, alpha subunit [Streptosporangium roseum DSM 43021]
MPGSEFVHLRVASGFSLLHGASRPQALVARAGGLGMSALALTDRDSLAGAVRFATACRTAGVRPVFGADLAVEGARSAAAPHRDRLRGEDVGRCRVTFLARDASGWSALCRMISAAHAADRDEPVLSRQALAAHAGRGGLVVLLGPDSDVGGAIVDRDAGTALKRLRAWQEGIGRDAVRLEIVCHLSPGPGPGSLVLAGRMLAFAARQRLVPVLTNAVRYAERSGARVGDVLAACRHRLPIGRARHANAEAYLKSPAEMTRVAEQVAAVAGLPAAAAGRLLACTLATARACTLDPVADLGIGDRRVHFPEPYLLGADPAGAADGVMRARCEAGLNARGMGADRVALQRLQEELAVIARLGYAPYFLTVAEITDMIRAMGVRVAARGSAAGSLAVYALGISGVDPLRHGLLMERFLSTRRRSLPDVDLDVESARRPEVYRAILGRYGPERVAAVSAAATYRVRSAIRDAGAALGVDAGEIDALATAFPHIRARDARRAMAELPQLAARGIRPDRLRLLWDLVEALDGLPRRTAMHPCAIIVSDATLLDRSPVQSVPAGAEGGLSMSQFDKDDVEALGLLKLDVLGVRMQSAIAHAVAEIARVEGHSVAIDDPAQVPLDDPAAFALIRSAETVGCFQIESPGQRDLLSRLRPESFADLIIDISLFRPGPVAADMITPFLAARHGRAPVDLPHADLAPVLAETCGVVVFHEQVIRILAIMTGCDPGQADEVRRALADGGEAERARTWFTAVATDRGYDPGVVERVWRTLAGFGSFGFAKAHAAAFALPTLQSAWLKAHHPAAFYAAVLTHDPGMYPKRLLLADARRHGVTILPLDVNHSAGPYRIEPLPRAGDTACGRFGVRLALADVKGITGAEVARIVAGRPYTSLADCWQRARPSLPIAERLVLAGALDALHGLSHGRGRRAGSGLTRRDLLIQVGELHRWTSASSRRPARRGSARPPVETGDGTAQQLPLALGAAETPRRNGLPDMSDADLVAAELDILGLDASRHLITDYHPLLRALAVTASSRLRGCSDGALVLVGGAKVAIATPPIRSGRRIMFCSLDDGTGITEVTFFDHTHAACAATAEDGRLLLVRGRIRRSGPDSVSVTATGCWNLAGLHTLWHARGIDAVHRRLAQAPDRWPLPAAPSSSCRR